jgi:hypothetical protein
MSKSNSGHFSGTNGAKLSRYTMIAHSKATKPSESDIISSRVKGFDLHEHPSKYKQLSSKRMTALRRKQQARTMTKHEYKTYESNKRLSARRDKGVQEFWNQEKTRIMNGSPTSRNWTPQQMHDILNDRKPKHNGKTMHAHHTYSVSKYPHLANKGEVIFPATFREHLYGWHGGNFKKSLPGKPINTKKLH